MTTVDVRSYSRYSGRIRLEIDNGTSSELSAEAMRSSCSGCRNENSRQIATASTFSRFNCLTPNHQHVFKPASRNERDACTLALQQSVCSDSRAVDHLDPIESRTSFRADARKSLLNGK